MGTSSEIGHPPCYPDGEAKLETHCPHVPQCRMTGETCLAFRRYVTKGPEVVPQTLEKDRGRLMRPFYPADKDEDFDDECE